MSASQLLLCEKWRGRTKVSLSIKFCDWTRVAKVHTNGLCIRFPLLWNTRSQTEWLKAAHASSQLLCVRSPGSASLGPLHSLPRLPQDPGRLRFRLEAEARGEDPLPTSCALLAPFVSCGRMTESPAPEGHGLEATLGSQRLPAVSCHMALTPGSSSHQTGAHTLQRELTLTLIGSCPLWGAHTYLSSYSPQRVHTHHRQFNSPWWIHTYYRQLHSP